MPPKNAPAYSSTERAKLNTYRDAYFALETSEERTDYLRKTLAVEFFNWRATQGKHMGAPDSEEMTAGIRVGGMFDS
jgi:hypothetical protein